MHRSLLAIGLTALAALGLGACGSGSSPEDDVREAAATALASEDPKEVCRELVTDRFLTEVFAGDVAACVKSSLVEDDPGNPVVTAVAIRDEDESRASVAILVKGGESDGVAGHLEFAEEEGEWRLDRFADDYMRSVFAVGVEEVDTGAISTPRMKACVGRQIDALAPPALRSLTYDALSDEDAAVKQVLAMAEDCPGPLADYVAEEFTKGLAGKRGPAYVRCLRQEIRSFLEITGLAPELIVAKPTFAALAALEGLAAGVRKNCLGR